MSFRKTDVTSVLAISILSFPNISALGTYSKLTCIVLSRCNFDDINVITDIGSIGITFFGNFVATQMIINKDNFYLL